MCSYCKNKNYLLNESEVMNRRTAKAKKHTLSKEKSKHASHVMFQIMLQVMYCLLAIRLQFDFIN